MDNLTKTIKKMRYLIIFSFLAIAFLAALQLRSYYIGDHDQNWILGSKEYVKLQEVEQEKIYVQKVIFPLSLDTLSRSEFEMLENVHKFLEKDPKIFKINSIFNYPFVLKFEEEDSSLVQMMTLGDIEAPKYDFFQENIEKFKQFGATDKKWLYFYLITKEQQKISSLPTKLNYVVTHVKKQKNEIEDRKLLQGLIVVLFIILLFAFRNINAPVIGTIFVSVTTVITAYLFSLFMGGTTPHISILLLSFCVSLIDYIYIYYNWYIYHKDFEADDVLEKTIDRTLVPILLTTVINSIGFGLLFISDSYMLQSLSMIVMISAVIGFILSFSFLPSMLSLFSIKNPALSSEKVSKFLTQRIKHYNKRVFRLFFMIIGALFIFAQIHLYQTSFSVDSENSSPLIKVIVDHSEFNETSLKEIEHIAKQLESEDVRKIESLYHMVKSFYQLEHSETFSLEKIDIDRYLFMLDLSGGFDQFIEADKLIINIYTKDLQAKNRVLEGLRKNAPNIIVKDMDSLLQSAKNDTIKSMILILFVMIGLIGIIVMMLTKNIAYLYIAMLVNVTPLTIFYTLVALLQLPITPEVFIAMIISIAISNDVTMHFIYYHNRFCGGLTPKGKTGVYELFTFVGSPLLLGNVILAFVFLLLVFTHIPSITAIGVFSAVLVILSILTDIFIMPILFLKMIPKGGVFKR
ncbi:MAG: hypothetical protein K0U47_11995 [Epsilonproteobacteria bacterium]|nr:hypothetical protein [Campylobacterota bacterium]